MKIFFFTLLSFLTLASYSQCGQTDLEGLKIKGKISTLKETGIEVNNGENKIIHIKTTRFNSRGNAQSYTFASVYDDLKPTKTTVEFDTKGHPIMEKRYDLNGKIENTLVNKYDSLGNMIEEIYFSGTSSLDSYSYFTYDANCYLTNYSSFMHDSSVWFSYAFLNDSSGFTIEMVDSNEATITKYVNDENGRPTSSITYDFGGNKISSLHYQYEFDRKKNLVKSTTLDEYGEELYGYGYLYDKKGNWIEKTWYNEGVVIWIEQREYTYIK